MSPLDPTALQSLQAVLRQLREIKGVRETQPSTFQLRGATFAQIVTTPAGLQAELKKSGGSGMDRYPLDTPPRQRKFIEDARLRAAQLDAE